MVAFTPKERLFGADAQVLRVKSPQLSVAYSLRLLGQPFNSTAVNARIVQESWPYELVEDLERGTFNYTINGETYSVESVVGMALENLKGLSEAQADGAVKDCVITIPPFFTRTQRMELVQVAEAAGLNVISLIHENTAAALYHGIDRLDNETSYFAIIYNLGASYLQVSLVKYSALEVKISRGNSRNVESIEVLAHAWDSELGGSTFDTLIAELLAKEFKDKHGIDPHSNARAMAKLGKKANEVKKTLSAAKSTQVYIEALLDGKDLVTTVTRETFESLLEPLVARLIKPIEDVLAQSGVSIDEVNDIELVGGVARVPKVQDAIKQLTKKDLSTHLNGDESMAHGAALFAANYTSEVQLKPMYLTDVVTFDIEGEFTDDKELNKKTTIFKKGAKLGTKKKITLSHGQNFKCIIKNVYAETAVPVDLYSLEGVVEFSEKHQQVPVSHLTFVLTLDGFAYLHEAEARVEVEEVVKEKAKIEKDSTKQNDGVKETSEQSETENQADSQEDAQAPESGESVSEKQDSPGDQDSSESESSDATQDLPNEEAASTSEYTERTVKKTIKDKLSVVKEELEHPRTLTRDNIRTLQKLFKRLITDDKARKRLAEAKNEVEGLVYYIKDKLSEDEFITVTTEAERQDLETFLTSTEQWLEETGSSDPSTYLAKTSELKAKSQPALNRVEERSNRALVVEKAYKQIDLIKTLLDEFEKTKSWISAEVKAEVYKKTSETKTWLDDTLAQQEGLNPWEAPVLTQVKIEAKLHALERSFDIVKRTPKPRPEKSEKSEKKSKMPNDFIKFGGGMDGSNIKMENVIIDGKEYSSNTDSTDDLPDDAKLEL